MRKSLFAFLALASLSFSACPAWVGQAAAYPVGTVVALNGQNYQATRTMDNGWISPTDTYFWTATTSTCSSTGGAANPGKVSPVWTTLVVEGVKQGRFKGESLRSNRLNSSDVVFVGQSILSPRDAATGAATGARQYSPLTVTKPWGAASPQFAQAQATNEVLKTVSLSFYGVGMDGVERVQTTINLTNANVASIVRHLDASGGLVEDISFTFTKIEVADILGGTMASDDWMPR